MSLKMSQINNSELLTLNSELPQGWRWVKLGEVCTSGGNRDPRTTPNLPFWYVDISSIDSRSKRTIEAREVLGKDAPSRARRVIKSNDILVATTRPNLNAVALVPKEFNNEICSTGFCVLRPTELTDPSFLFAFVQTKFFIETISGQVRGMLYPAVTDNQVRNVYLPLPPLSEQRCIAGKLQELMEEVEHARTACEKQSEAAKTLSAAYLREVFESEESIKWERKRLGEVCEIVTGSTPKTDDPSNWNGEIFWATPNDMGKLRDFTIEDTERKISQKGFESCSTKLLPPGSVLFTTRAPIGHLAINLKPMCTNQGFKSFIPTSKIYNWFLFFALKYFVPVLQSMGRGQTFSEISKGQVENFEIPVPHHTEQNKIATYLKEKMEQLENLKSTIRNQQSALESLPQAILRKAFRGEL